MYRKVLDGLALVLTSCTVVLLAAGASNLWTLLAAIGVAVYWMGRLCRMAGSPARR